ARAAAQRLRQPHSVRKLRKLSAALNKLSPALGAGSAVPRDARPRRRPLQSLTPLKHFVVAASAATKLPATSFFPAPSAGLRLLSAPSRASSAPSYGSRHRNLVSFLFYAEGTAASVVVFVLRGRRPRAREGVLHNFSPALCAG